MHINIFAIVLEYILSKLGKLKTCVVLKSKNFRNLIKVEDEWYLVDATWNLGKDSLDYFMVKDIKKGNRTPINIGYDLPGYSSLEQSGTERAVTPSDIIIE